MTINALLHQIRTAPIAGPADLQALINAVSSRIGDELDVCDGILDHLDAASEAIEVPPPAPFCRDCDDARDEGEPSCRRCAREARREACAA